MREDKRLRRKVRSSYFISTISIALVLFLLGSVGYLILNAVGISTKVKENVMVYVMLDDSLSVDKREIVSNELQVEGMVREITYVTKEEAAEEHKKQTGEDFESFLDFNPLPDSYEVRMTADGSSAEFLKKYEAKVVQLEGVDEVIYQRGVVEQIGRNINTFNMIIVVFGLALLVISVILLNNTIRVSIYSKRHIISTMKLIGATQWFIMRPFVWSSILQGIYAALIATAMFVGLVYGVNRGLPEINLHLAQEQLLWIVGGIFLAGILISLIFTIFAVNKFIKLPTNAIHLY